MGFEIWLLISVVGLGAVVYLMYRQAVRQGYSEECIEERKQWKGAKKQA